MAEIRITRDVFLWCIAVTYLFTFSSLFVQIPGLYGDKGILPAKIVLDQEAESFSDLIGHQPTLLRLLPHIGFSCQAALDFLCVGGSLLSFVAIVSRDQRNSVVFAVLWMFYLSIFQVGQSFLWFQWDVLLLEVGFLTILIAPLNFFGLHDAVWHHAHDTITFFLVRWLLFRLTFTSGVTKLTSNSDSWWNLTAFAHHYETQFLPTPVAWYFHQLPLWIQKLSAAGVLTTEIAGSLLMLSPIRSHRIVAFYTQVLLLSVMTLTGNYGFYTLLTLTLCLSLVDDEWLNSWTKHHSFKGSGREADGNALNREQDMLRLTFCVLTYAAILIGVIKLFGLSININTMSIESAVTFTHDEFSNAVGILTILSMCVAGVSLIAEAILAATRSHYNKKLNPSKRLTELAGCIVFGVAALGVFTLSAIPFAATSSNVHSYLPQQLHDVQFWTTKNYQLTSPYMFHRRTSEETDGRPEIIIEGSNEIDSGWTEYKFRFKPGNMSESLPIVAPHQPRLDYQLWFAARGRYQDNHWLLNLVYRMLTNQPEVMQLMGENPFPDEPPKYIRASLYKYYFTTNDKHSDKYSDSNWWSRERVGNYLPVVSKDEPSFVRYLKQSALFEDDDDDTGHASKAEKDWTSILQAIIGQLRSLLNQGSGSCLCLILVVTGFLLTLLDPSITLFRSQPLVDGVVPYELAMN